MDAAAVMVQPVLHANQSVPTLPSPLPLDDCPLLIPLTGSPPSSAFANSTTPALSLSDVQSSFSPVSYAVSVNTLWVLSLSLSLISAFFAIAAQQWLRQLHLPPDMPVRRAVQLLEVRKDGLKTWQVPSIIALLPLLLQIAVIFFLIGLFLLLRSLNATVATAFGSVAVVGLLAFLVTTVIPLITSPCPYKTPLVPTLAVILQCLSYPLAALSVPFAIFLFLSMVTLFLFLRLINADARADWMLERLEPIGDYITDNLFQYVQSFGRHMFVDMGEFWLTREYHYICLRDEADAPGNLKLERSSLIQTFLSTPARRSSKVSQLLNGSDSNSSAQGVQDTVVSSLRAFRTGLKWSDLIPGWKLDSKMAPYIGKWLSARHHRLLWQYLQQRDWKRDGEVPFDDSQCLIVFHELDNTFPATRPRYAKYLLQICDKQELSEYCTHREALPAYLALDLILNRGYVLDEDDADALLAFTSKVYSKYRGDLGDHDRRRLFLVSTALALIAANKSGATHSASITSVVNILAGALDKESTKENAVSELQRYYRDGSNWAHYYPEYMSPARIMEALCEALSEHAASPLLSPSPAHLQDLARISTALRRICSNEKYKAKPEMEKVREVLYIFDVRVKDIEVASRKISSTAVESTMRVSEPAEARLQYGDPNEDSDCTPVISLLRDGPNVTSSVPASSAEPAVTADTAVFTDNTEFVEFTKNNEGQDPPVIAASANHSDLLSPPSAETNNADNSTDTDPTTFVAVGSDPAISFTQDALETRETRTNLAPEPQETQAEVSALPAVEGLSSAQGPEPSSAADADSVEDDAPNKADNHDIEQANSGESVAGSGTTGGE